MPAGTAAKAGGTKAVPVSAGGRPPAARQPAKAVPKPAKAVPKPAFTEPAPPAKTPEPAAPPARTVDGVRVVKEEALRSPLSAHVGVPVVFHTLRVLTLENGQQVCGCADCPDVTGTRSEVKRHRIAAHGEPAGGRTRKNTGKSGLALPPDAASITIGELVALAAHVDKWEDENHRLATALAEANARADAAEKKLAALHKALGRIPGLKIEVEA